MKNIFSLEKKVAAITGGASGIGAAIVKVFAEQGASVCILDIDEKQGKELALTIREAGGQAIFYPCNIVDEQQVETVMDDLFRSHGRLDILVNNAAVAHIGNVETTTAAEMDRLYDVNIKGAFHCIKKGIAYMKEDGGGGVILNIASVAAVLGLADRFAYSMSKGAILTMTYSVAKDYLADHIRCNAIGPGRVHTPFVDGFLKENYPAQEKEMFEKLSKTQPIGRMAKPTEIAHMALYLCSDEAAFVTGSFFPIDGGFMTLNT